MHADGELWVEAWKLAALPPRPEAIALNIFGQNQKSEKLQTTRLLLHADFQQSDAWFQRVARDRKPPAVFFFFSNVKG